MRLASIPTSAQIDLTIVPQVSAVPLTQQQNERAIAALKEYLAAPPNSHGRTPKQIEEERDRNRVSLIDGELGALVNNYLNGDLALASFKSQIDGINKRHAHWGFRGIKGQMFFNMLLNVAGDLPECDRELKAAIREPRDDASARDQIVAFTTYVERLGDEFVAGGGSKHGRPKVASTPYFLSYFWQVQNRHRWPVYYTNSVNVLSDLNIWQPTGEPGADYVAYKQVHVILGELFSAASGEHYGFYEVEHVFWIKGGNSVDAHASAPESGSSVRAPAQPSARSVERPHPVFSDSYVPPIVANLPLLSLNDPALQNATRDAGSTIDRVFEKSVDATFRILGYETKLLGQGQGRVPDGQALSLDDSYGVLWDAKVRESGYSMGTDDRAIREYINTQSRELKRRATLKHLYYAIVSSSFQDDFENTVRLLKMETHISEVVLVQADALVAMVDAKLRDPRGVTLGPDGLQRLFSDGGTIDASTVREILS